MKVKRDCHLFDECVVPLSFDLVFCDSLGSFLRRFMLTFRYSLVVFFLFLFLLCSRERMSIYLDEPLIRGAVKHGNCVRLIPILVAVTLVVIEFGNRRPVAVVGFG